MSKPMTVNYLHQEPLLSDRALEMMQFDMDSIRRIIAGQRAAEPDIWLVDPGQYEKDGRLLRDSATYRIVAYSAVNRVLYASDGCNACAQPVDDLCNVRGVPEDLLRRLTSLVV